MRFRLHRLGVLLLTATVRVGAQPTLPSSQLTPRVVITITPDERGETYVRERFVGVGDSIVLQPRLRALTRSCARIHAVDWRVATTSAPLIPGAPGVWVEYTDSLGLMRGASGSEFELNYMVSGSGVMRDIPLLLPAHPIPRTEGMREGNVTVLVEGSHTEVRFPQLAHDERSGKWSGHFVAIPSFVRLTSNSSDTTSCKSTPARGDDGGLVWRFGVLVAILVAWVPLYLGWARRVTSADV